MTRENESCITGGKIAVTEKPALDPKGSGAFFLAKETKETMDFSTSQQYIVAALFCTPNITFEGARMAGGRVDFVFAPRDRAEKVAGDFYAGRLMVSAKQFADSIERFRDEAFGRRRELAESERRMNNDYWK